MASRLERLQSLGTVTTVNGSGTFRLDPNAHRTVLDVAERGSGSHDRSSARSVDSSSHRLALFQQEPVLRDLPYEELVWLAGVSRTQELATGEVVFLEGDDCHGLYIVERAHPPQQGGDRLITGRRLTQREIAEMAGTAREVVARVLKKMKHAGAIAVNRGDVKILDTELLESFM